MNECLYCGKKCNGEFCGKKCKGRWGKEIRKSREEKDDEYEE